MTSRRLCGGMLVAMATAMPSLPLTSRLGNRAGQDGRDLVLARVVVLEVDRVLIDPVEQVGGDVGEAALGVAGRSRPVVQRPEVAVTVDEGMAQAEGLGHAHQGVVERQIAVRVIPAHDVAGNPGALEVRAVRAGLPCRACRRAGGGEPA